MVAWLDLVLGSVTGAVVSESLKGSIKVAKQFKDFKPLSKDLAETMVKLTPLVKDIDSIQEKLNFSTGELKKLRDTISKAQNVVDECQGSVSFRKKRKLTKKIMGINKDMLKFCQTDIQLLLLRNQLKLTVKVDGISESQDHLTVKVDGISESQDHLTVKVDGMRKSVDDFKVSLDGISASQDHLTVKVDGMSKSADDVKVSVDSIRESQDHLTVKVDGMRKSQDHLTVKVDGISESQDHLTVKVDGIRESQDHLIDSMSKSVDDFKFSVDGISERVNHLTVSFDGIRKSMDYSSIPAPPNFVDLCSVPKLNMVPVGLDLPLMDLKMKLLNDSVASLVVSAPPGCGKTTLVTQLCHDKDIKNKFKNIFFSVVSHTPNFKGIIQNLLRHNGYAARTFENNSQAGVALRSLLEKLNENSKKTLLVLDDLWQGAEHLFLKFFPINLPDFKILVTSRFDLPSIGPTFKLKPLKDEDATTLLIQCASRPDAASPDEYEELLQKILKRCNGLPIAIEVIGGSLKGRSLNSWNSKVESWFKGKPILDNSTVEECLQPSFDALDLNLKECFLDMGSFLEDQKIRASVIIDIWVELYGQSSIVCMNYIEDLASQNLLKLVPLGSNKLEDGFFNEFLVTQHDILRELAIYQNKSEASLEKKRLNMKIRNNAFPGWCLNPRHPIVKASLLSISTDDLFSSSWVEMDCPNVEALVLNLSSSDYELPSFIAGMKKLKVLTVENHGFYPSRLSNFSCLSSLPNLKRIRLEKVMITLLDVPQLQLSSLEKLSLVMCRFGEVTYDREDVVFTKALSSLEEIDIDYCYDLEELPYWISEAASLKTLSITNCNKLSILPEAIGNLSKLKMLRLYSCINLLELPETIERLINLQVLDISHCLEMRKWPQEIGKLQNLKKISMRKCSRCKLPDSVRNLENLVVKCDEETGFLWEKLKPKMRKLRVHEEETEQNLNLLHMY